jgi:hypothetical protein
MNNIKELLEFLGKNKLTSTLLKVVKQHVYFVKAGVGGEQKHAGFRISSLT